MCPTDGYNEPNVKEKEEVQHYDPFAQYQKTPKLGDHQGHRLEIVCKALAQSLWDNRPEASRVIVEADHNMDRGGKAELRRPPDVCKHVFSQREVPSRFLNLICAIHGQDLEKMGYNGLQAAMADAENLRRKL